MPSPAAKSSSRTGRLWLACMGIVLAAAGCVFTTVLWRSFQRAMETRSWSETPCRIVSSSIRSERPTPHSPVSHRFAVRYEFEFQGRKRTGTKVERTEGPTAHREKADALAAEFPAGRATVCWVNPAMPDEAVLRHGSKAGLYTIWFPLLFVLGGGVMAWRAIRR